MSLWGASVTWLDWQKNPDTSTGFLNTSLGTLFQIPSRTIFPLTPSLSLSGASSAISSHPLPSLGGDTEPPHHNLLSGSCKELKGPPQISFSPGWTAPAPSALLLVLQPLHKASSTHRQEQHPHYPKQARLLPAHNISQTLLINFSSMQDE